MGEKTRQREEALDASVVLPNLLQSQQEMESNRWMTNLLTVIQITIIILSSFALPGSLLVGYAFGAKKSWKYLTLIGYIVYDLTYSLLYWFLIRGIVG